MKDVHVVGKKMTRNAGKMAKLIGCAFHFETEFTVRPRTTWPQAKRTLQMHIENDE